ncbi:MAG: bifunctional 3,4-dihydroxy-2-butanone 4-phosphate synthase/GTP cyclohydrolase II [Lentisphaerae bacterium RIFOXYA12_FULL_48_11]|nr:MAG: bifunctional 3,4-dihydroxy-2-butanone 4-phosphate synthase/GTP cyclohydrolase II [Lentisphaerae bacterium RIFOXYA12_FULL_48_11]
MLDPVSTVIKAIKQGHMVIITDDEKRENEGDLVMAAERVSARAINFMTKFGRGLVCVALTAQRLQHLGLKRMALKGTGDAFRTAFMESVDASHGITTGISAHDRAMTIRRLVDAKSRSDDFVSPGHTFPLEAMAGGVLRRAGHTEAAVDLSRLAGFKPAGVICEILNEDGTMARLPNLVVFAKKHNIKMTSIADLIAYRGKTENLVTLEREVAFPTKHGTFKLKLFKSIVDGEHHVALVMGDILKARSPLVRVHSQCLTGDVLGSLRCDCGSQLDHAMKMIQQEGVGVVLYMMQEGRGIGLANKIHAYELQDMGLDTVEANEKLGFDADLRDYGVGAQILCALGLKKIRLMTNNPRKIVGLEGYCLKIVERIPIICPANKYSERYLRTKKEKLGHIL